MADQVYLALSNPSGDVEDPEVGAGVPDEYNEFVIMREMGWDWWTYQRQPDFVIDRVRAFMAAEAKASESRAKKHG